MLAIIFPTLHKVRCIECKRRMEKTEGLTFPTGFVCTDCLFEMSEEVQSQTDPEIQMLCASCGNVTDDSLCPSCQEFALNHSASWEIPHPITAGPALHKAPLPGEEPMPATLPIFCMFHLDKPIYSRICIFARKQNKSLFEAMQDLMELGLFTYAEYDADVRTGKSSVIQLPHRP